MSSYVVPQVVVYQQFRAVAEAVEVRLNSFIFGPNYKLMRYDHPTEKLDITLGEYARTADTAYLWPNRPANATVDQSWVSLFFDNAWLRYAELPNATYTIAPVVGHPSRLNIDNTNLTTFTNSSTTYTRNVLFRDRDVRAGDGVIVRYEDGSENLVFRSTISRLIHDAVAAVVGAAYDDTSNTGSSSVGSTVTLESGTAGAITLTADESSYDGSADGDITEDYTVAVVTAGAFGTARLSVTSASGNDDVADLITPADGTPIAIGSRGLMATFATGTGNFEAGMYWTIEVAQDWVPSTVTSGGTYTGLNAGTYVINVTSGAEWADEPAIFVTSTGTLDTSGPYTVEDGVAVTLPSGATITLTGGTGLSAGDRYYVDATPAENGAVRTVELRNSLPTAITDPSSTPPDLDIDFNIIKNIEVNRVRSGIDINWATSASEITVMAGISGFDDSWYDGAGNLLSMPVLYANMYAEYRALLRVLSTAVQTIDNIGDVVTQLGVIAEGNPLALGVFKALQNSGGTPVKYMAVPTDDLTGYLAVLDAIYDREDVYGLVPLTHVREIQNAVAGAVNTASSADRGRWRVCWFAASLDEQSVVVKNTSTGGLVTATIADDPDTVSVVDYIMVHSTNANFVTNGAAAGDLLRVNYFVDPNTNEEVYEEYVIDDVITEEQVRLLTGPSAAVTIASRIEIWHNNTKDEMAQNVASFAGSFSNRRVRVVFPDTISSGGTDYDGMFAAAALSGLRSGVAYHQGLTNVEITGFDDVSRTTEFFGGRQLDTMAASGVWIIAQDVTGTVYTRHQLTTDMSDLRLREDSMVSNFDAISYYFLRFFRNARYIGRRNITPRLLGQLRTDFVGVTRYLLVSTDVGDLGPQLLDATIESLEQHPLLADKVVARISVELPAPFNGLDIYITA